MKQEVCEAIQPSRVTVKQNPPLRLQNESVRYRRCTRCVMDTTDPLIEFDEDGVCHHCRTYEERAQQRVHRGPSGLEELHGIIERIKREGKGKEYDCILGVSGGLDSSYTAYWAKKMGLRPLAVHFDNGWNSEIAVKNIEQLLNKLDFELLTYVMDWEEFRDIQRSFLFGSTVEGEVPTDHAINALMFNLAIKNGIRYVISGANFSTEGVQVPSWGYGHFDWKYIRSIQRRFGTRSIRHLPHLTLWRWFYLFVLRRMQVVAPLNYLRYHRNLAVDELEKELGYRYYGGKHGESIYTRFYQGYVLPTKFDVDKRKAHLSSLILGETEMSREDAIEELSRAPYDEEVMAQDREFVLKKLGFTEAEFVEIMNAPINTHRDYPSNYSAIQFMRKVQQRFRQFGWFPK